MKHSSGGVLVQGRSICWSCDWN